MRKPYERCPIKHIVPQIFSLRDDPYHLLSIPYFSNTH
jgi:hypothetical protein